jgi:hypothetical protein
MALSSSPGSNHTMRGLDSGGNGSPTAPAGSGGSGRGSPAAVSPVEQFLAAAAAAAAHHHHHSQQLASLGSSGSGQLCASDTTTDGLCPTLPAHGGFGSSGSCSTAGSGGADEPPRKLAVLGLPWETS